MNDVIMFVDTGIDDAVAILLSAFDTRTKLRAIVACEGNSSLDDVTNKTLQIVEFIKKDIPVFKGYAGNLSPKPFNIAGVHGPQGNLGGFNFPTPKKQAKSFEEFVKYFKSLPKKVDILCISSLTTLAKILKDDPALKQKICHLYFQGGLLEDPNYLGYNVAHDPVAAEYILQLQPRLMICPSDFGHKAYLTKKDVEKLKNINKTGAMLEYIFRSYHDRAVGDKGVATHDGVASFLVRHWGFFLLRRAHVFIEYNSDGYGILKFDFKAKPKNARVCTIMYKPKFKRFVFSLVKKAK